jgi:TIR domain
MKLSPRAKRRVFIAHSSRDRRFVGRVARILDQHKISYRYSATHIVGAKQWHDEIGHALTHCNWFLVVLTPDAVRSKWVKRELVFALSEDRYSNRIVPLVCKPCNYSRLSWALRTLEMVDFTDSFETGCERLLRVWRLRYRPKPVKSRFKKKTK